MQSEGGAAADGHDFKPEQRLHPTSWLFVTANYLRHLLLPLLAALLVGARRDVGWWMPSLMIGPIIVAALWQQHIYRYGFSARGLVIHEGLFFRNIRTIDYERIENVDTERGLLHRLFNVAVVRVETSTGGGTEALIRVLDLAAVEEIRRHIFSRRTQTSALAGGEAPLETAREPRETLLHLGPPELVRFGLIDNRGMLLVAAALGVLSQGGFFEALQQWLSPVLAQLPWENLAGFSLLTKVLLGVTTAIGLIASTRVLSIIVAFAMLYDFRLTRQGTDLHARYGLLTRISMTLRLRRIQAVHQTATLLHRVMKRVSLRVDLAGGSPGTGAEHGAEQNSRELWLAPLCLAEQSEALVRIALPQVRLEPLDWKGLAPRTRRRVFRMLCVTWLVVASAPAVWFTGWWALLILAAPLPLFWLHASLYVKYTGWAVHEQFFVLRRGWLTRRLSIVPRDRIQTVHVRESPFDRRYRMAELHVDHAGTSALHHRFTISHLDSSDARRLSAQLYRSQLSSLTPALPGDYASGTGL